MKNIFSNRELKIFQVLIESIRESLCMSFKIMFDLLEFQ